MSATTTPASAVDCRFGTAAQPGWVRAGSVAIAFFAIAATTMLVYVQRSQYQDNTGTPVDFVDALYFATVSLSTTGRDITPPQTKRGW